MDAIRIRTERAELEIKSEPAQLRVNTRRPTFKVRRKAPQMRVSREKPTFKVNWVEVRAQMGNKLPVRFAQETASKAQQKIMSGIGRIAHEGNRMSDIEKGDTIPRIIRDRLRSEMPELNIGLMPKESPKVQWEKGHMKIEWDDLVFEMEWEDGDMRIEVEPHSVEVSLRNRPSIQIWVERDEKTGELTAQTAVKDEKKKADG